MVEGLCVYLYLISFLFLCLGLSSITSIFTPSSMNLLAHYLRRLEKNKLLEFYNLIRPYGFGWSGFVKKHKIINVSSDGESAMRDLLLVFLGVVMVYFGLFGLGYILYNQLALGIIMLCLSSLSFLITNYIMSFNKKD